MDGQIRSIKGVFLPPHPKDTSPELSAYFREIERNLRDLASRGYSDTEVSFSSLVVLRDELIVLKGDLESGIERVGVLEGDILDLVQEIEDILSQFDPITLELTSIRADVTNLTSSVSGLNSSLNALINKVNMGGGIRPSNPSLYQSFFDSNLGQPIWWSGEDWVDSEGNIV